MGSFISGLRGQSKAILKEFDVIMEAARYWWVRTDGAGVLLDPAKFERLAYELEKKLDILGKRVDDVHTLVKSTVEPSTVQKNFDGLLHQFKSVKALDGKPMVKKFDLFIKDLEMMDMFPKRICILVERVVFYVAIIGAMLQKMGFKSGKIEDVTQKLPEKYKGVHLNEGLFSEIGKISKELLYQYYDSGMSVKFLAHSTGGAYFSARSAEGFLWDMIMKSRANMQSNILRTTFNIHDLLVPGLKGSFSFPLPTSFVEGKLHYLHSYGGALASVKLAANPIVKLSCLFGIKAFSCGVDVGINVASRTFIKYDGAVSYNQNDFDAVIKLKNQCDCLACSFYYKRGSLAFAAEYAYEFPTHQNRLMVGLSHAVNPVTTLKARVDNYFVASGVLQRSWGKSSVALSLGADLIKRAPRVGLSVKFGGVQVS